jgi:hypothetical protein
MNDKLSSIIKEYKQFTDSLLIEDIQYVMQCDKRTAQDLARSHCNLVSFWAGIKVQGYTDIEYSDYFKLLLEHDFVKPNGYFNVLKNKIMFDIFGINFKLTYFEEFEEIINPTRLNKESLYQMKLVNSMHFIICSVDKSGLVLIYDTGTRGVGVPAVGANRVNEKYFSWIMEIPLKEANNEQGKSRC